MRVRAGDDTVATEDMQSAESVGSNSIQCSVCSLWVHKTCTSISGRLQNVADRKFPVCKGNYMREGQEQIFPCRIVF